jgi:hypothetical protein
MALARQFVREAETHTVPQYRSRVRKLAGIYTGVVIAAATAIVLIIVRGKLFVTLSQHSNVETLTLALILLLFTYLAILSLPGAWGALKILYYNLPARLGRDRAAVEARKQAALKQCQGKPDAVYLNCLVRRQGSPDAPITIPLQDDAGSLGAVIIDGAKITREEGSWHSSNALFAYLERRIEQLVNQRHPQALVEIVQWATIDDESARQYESLVAFSRNLAKHLGSGPLWPAVELTGEDIATLTREGAELCPILRDEAHLPDLEYSAEHRVPIIPEPLAFISLSRQEQRADPEASMGCALVVALIILAFLVLFILWPPWVPSK